MIARVKRAFSPRRTIGGLARGCVLLALSAAVPAAVPASSSANGAMRDTSPVIADSRGLELPSRPRVASPFELVHRSPDIRVTLSHALAGPRADTDLDGLPDRAVIALDATVAALRLCTELGLGSPLDDGDGELDLFVLALGGGAPGYVHLERQLLPAHGASGYVVIDGSLIASDATFRSRVIRSIVRLALAGTDADAPEWWADPTARWIESRIVPGSRSVIPAALSRDRLSLASTVQRDATGPISRDPGTGAHNLALLSALDDHEAEHLALSSSWAALAQREPGRPRVDAIDAALRSAIGLDLEALFRRSVIRRILDLGPDPGTPVIETLPVSDVGSPRPIDPGGVQIVRIRPGSASGTHLELASDDDAWSVTLLALTKRGRWEGVTIDAFGPGSRGILLPWSDYESAVLVASRLLQESQSAGISITARPADLDDLFALSFSGGRVSRRTASVEISWSTAWESKLFGWIVERSRSSGGPWETAHAFPLPALGRADEGAAYSIVDPWPGGEAPVYYRIVGLTELGLRLPSPPFAVVTSTHP